MARWIQLTNNYLAIVDDEDFERVSRHSWQVRILPPGRMYAKGMIKREDGGWRYTTLHRFILGVTDPKIHVDHINHDGLDCRRSNMRLATAAQNGANKRMRKNKTEGFKGVSMHRGNRWRVRVGPNHVGCFLTAEEAARAYDIAAIARFGEFALTNEKLGLLRSVATA